MDQLSHMCACDYKNVISRAKCHWAYECYITCCCWLLWYVPCHFSSAGFRTLSTDSAESYLFGRNTYSLVIFFKFRIKDESTQSKDIGKKLWPKTKQTGVSFIPFPFTTWNVDNVEKCYNIGNATAGYFAISLHYCLIDMFWELSIRIKLMFASCNIF